MVNLKGHAAAIAEDNNSKGWQDIDKAVNYVLDGAKVSYEEMQHAIATPLETSMEVIGTRIPLGWKASRDQLGTSVDASKVLLHNTEGYPKLSPEALLISTAVDVITNDIHKAASTE